jgi:hypothetical protein
MGDLARPAARPLRPQRIAEPLDLPGPGIPPAAQHTVPARRAADPTNGQPELDADNISLYRHHRCLQALQRGIPQAGQGFSGVPRTHQFLVTLTVHTNKINPATTPTATSAAVMTNATPWSSSRETVNTPVHQAVIIHVVEGDLLSVQGLPS